MSTKPHFFNRKRPGNQKGGKPRLGRSPVGQFNRRRRCITLATLLILWVTAIGHAQAQILLDEDNLIGNGDFENGFGPFDDVASGTLALEKFKSRTGQNSLRHTATGNDSFTRPYWGPEAGLAAAIAGETFQMAVSARAETETPVQLRIYCLDSRGNGVGHGLADYTATEKWRVLTKTYSCPSGTAQVSVRLDNDGGAGNVVWWDDLRLVRVVDNSEIVGQNLPTTLSPGEIAQISVTVRNTGSTVWTAEEKYRLGAQNTGVNPSLGPGRVLLEDGESVFPNETKTFNINVTSNEPG